MSDVAVTWAKAQECVDKDGRRDRNAKDVLKTMAAWADAAGSVWAAVPVLAIECDVSERTVQRGLRALKAYGLLIQTAETKTYRGRVYPIYQMPLETGHASTVRRLEAERKASSRGDASVTPSEARPVTSASPLDDTGVTPPGDTGVTQIGKEIPQGLKPSGSVRASEAACRVWAEKAPERVSPRHAERAWLAAVERSGVDGDRLLSAVRAAVARDPDFARDRAMNLDRWLDEDRFEAWLPEGDAPAQAPAMKGWAGPADVAKAVRQAMGPEGVASYLDPADWREDGRVIEAATRLGAERLLAGVGRVLRDMGVRVEVRRG